MIKTMHQIFLKPKVRYSHLINEDFPVFNRQNYFVLKVPIMFHVERLKILFVKLTKHARGFFYNFRITSYLDIRGKI